MESKWRLFLVLFFWGSNITLFPPRPNGLRSTIHVYFISLFCVSTVVSFADSFISFSRSYRSTSAYIKKKKEENPILCSPLFGLFICSVVSCRLVKQQCLSESVPFCKFMTPSNHQGACLHWSMGLLRKEP